MTPPQGEVPHRHKLFTRFDANPILTAEEWPYAVNTVFNAGATLLQDGTTLLLVRAEDMRGISHLCVARSEDGLTNWKIDRKPTFVPNPADYPEEVWGIEDPRITWIPEEQLYAVAYTSYSVSGPGVSIALTEDFESFERMGMVQPADDKDAALFPRKFDGRWTMIHRPSSPDRPAHMWMSRSPDLKHWGDYQMLMPARRGAWWDARKIGLCTAPMLTDRGWLVLYHGVRTTASGSIYRLGAALLDTENPGHVVLRGDEWIFGPEEDYERAGDVSDVVFPCGMVLGEDGDTLRMYYGAADTCMGVATGSLSELLDWMEDHGRGGTSPPGA
jgi:predicted GH43/DUF377 family glycosyl hydrolase